MIRVSRKGVFLIEPLEKSYSKRSLIKKSFKIKKDKNSMIILTTPNPYFRLIHEFGAKIHLFSNDASDDHEELIS